MAAVATDRRSNQPKRIFVMKKRMRFLVCASAAALILGAAPIGAFIALAQAQVGVAITAGIAPPLLPVYDQPPIPAAGYVWIPGYWAWDGYEYYWTPGYWATPPAVGLYWTPPYWAWADGDYTFYPGFWGPTVGFYGGIAYGFGYTGVGYDGGYWQNNQFVYNAAVDNFGGANIVNAYSRPVANRNNRVAFSGGNGGVVARPTQGQIAARAHGMPPTAAQAQHQQMASRDPALRFNANHGQPPIAAIQRASGFHGAHATAATNAPEKRQQAAAPSPPVRPGVAQAPPAHPQAAAPPARPEVATHAPVARPEVAPPAHPEVAQHAPVMRQHYAYHAPARHAVVAPRRFAYHAPARFVARPHFAYHAPAMHAPVMHAFAARPHFAYHAPAVRMAPMGGMHMGGAPHFGGMRIGGAPHFGAPHIGGAPQGGGGGHRHVP
jgi:hypothetical protein